MKLTLIGLNLFAALYVFLFAMPFTQYTQDVNTATMSGKLYEAGVINQEQREEMYPMALEKYGYRDLQRTINWMIGYPCIAGFIINALLIGFFMNRKKKAEPVN